MNNQSNSKIIIGTSGYAYQDWSGIFYPTDIKKTDFLPFYAERFNFTELNFTYYAQPSPTTIERILDKVDQSFLFAVKAHKSMTHDMSHMQKNIETFKQGISPLYQSGQLAAVLCQFPYSFHYTKNNRIYLAYLIEQLACYPLCIEFRNREWQQTSVYQELSKRETALVLTDNPQLAGLPIRDIQVTTSLSYIRFHGRNKAAWWTGDATSRYDYLYKKRELMEWIPEIKSILNKSKILYVAFNNHYKGKAAENACQLKSLLQEHNINSL